MQHAADNESKAVRNLENLIRCQVTVPAIVGEGLQYLNYILTMNVV